MSAYNDPPEGGEGSSPLPPDPPDSQPEWSPPVAPPAPGGAPAAPAPPAAVSVPPSPTEPPTDSGGWVAPPAATDGHGADNSWPVPAGEPPPAASIVASEAAEPHDGHPHHPPHGQSRNPVDRLTRGLPHPLRVTIDWIVTIVGAIAIVLLVKAFVVNPYRIPSSSMEPTLHCARPEVGCEARYSDRVLANRFLYHLRDPRRGEIIVFRTPPEAQIKCGAGGTFVKRLIALPGDTVELRLRGGDGYVYINGKPLKEPYIEKARRAATQAYGPVKVKPGNYFMMGDNRSQSCDSRMWGTVPRANLIGKVFATYWPPNRVSLH